MEWGTFTDVLPCEAPTSVGFQLPAQWLGKFRQTEMGSPHVFLFSQGAENSCFIYFVHLYFCLCCQCNDTIIVTFSRLEPRDSTILCELEVGLHFYTNLLTQSYVLFFEDRSAHWSSVLSLLHQLCPECVISDFQF